MVIQRFILLAFLILCITAAVNSQPKTLNIINSTGSPMLQAQGKTDWKKIFTGTKISSQDNIKITQGDYVAYAGEDGVSGDLTKPGIYTFNDLIKNIAGKNSSFNKKYAKLILNEISKTQVSNEMKMLGAVSRLWPNQLFTACPNTAVCLSPAVTLKWYANSSVSAYLVSVINSQRRCIYMEDTKDTVYVLNRIKLKLQTGADYIITIKGIGDVQMLSDSLKIKFLPDEVSNHILDSIKINQSDDFSNSAVSNLSAGVFLENYHCNFEAEPYLFESVKLSGGLAGYLEHYLQFLVRTGQEKRAMEIQRQYLKE